MNVIKGTIKSAMPSMMMPLEIRAAFESSVEKSKNNESEGQTVDPETNKECN